jgi:hypothetical protein
MTAVGTKTHVNSEQDVVARHLNVVERRLGNDDHDRGRRPFASSCRSVSTSCSRSSTS